MIEKLFGRKSTGIVTIVCSAVILIALTVYSVMYLRGMMSSLMDFLGYVFFCATALAVLLLPHLFQKKFKIYIPTFIVVMLSLFVVIYLISDLLPFGNTRSLLRLMPLFGGVAISMTIFSVVVSFMYYRRSKKGKDNVSPVLAAVITFALSGITVLIWHLVQYLVAIIIYKHAPGVITEYLTAAGFYQIGIGGFCIVGAIEIFLNDAERYRIKSYKDLDKAKQRAIKNGDKGFYKVIQNNERDNTNYRKIYLSARSKFLLGKIIYYVIYAGYLAYLVVFYYKEQLINLVLIIALIASFVLSLAVSVYEYRLFKNKVVSSRLYRLKITKSALRILALGLIFAIMFQADYNFENFDYTFFGDLTVITSSVMIIVNIVTLINNFRKDFKLSDSERIGGVVIAPKNRRGKLLWETSTDESDDGNAENDLTPSPANKDS